MAPSSSCAHFRRSIKGPDPRCRKQKAGRCLRRTVIAQSSASSLRRRLCSWPALLRPPRTRRPPAGTGTGRPGVGTAAIRIPAVGPVPRRRSMAAQVRLAEATAGVKDMAAGPRLVGPRVVAARGLRAGRGSVVVERRIVAAAWYWRAAAVAVPVPREPRTARVMPATGAIPLPLGRLPHPPCGVGQEVTTRSRAVAPARLARVSRTYRAPAGQMALCGPIAGR
jgi:hypothetical protein